MKLSDDYNAFGEFSWQVYIISLVLGCGAVPFLVIGLFSFLGILLYMQFFLFIGIGMIIAASYVMRWGGNKQEMELAKIYGYTIDEWRKL